MSFSGLDQFRKNLDYLMDSDAFKNASDAERLKLGSALLRSRYGVWPGKVKNLANDCSECKSGKFIEIINQNTPKNE